MSHTASPPPQVRLALVQMSCQADRQTNLDRALQSITQAAEQGADIVCLQELFASLYPCQTEDHTRFDLAESIPGPTSERLARAAAQQRRGGRRFACSNGVRRASITTRRSFSTPTAAWQVSTARCTSRTTRCYYEKFYFTPGDLGFRSIPTRKGRLGVCVCWDQWFPEAARLTALAGAEILFYPTAIGWLIDEKEQFGCQPALPPGRR